MLSRVAAGLTGLVLLVGAWWMADRNSAPPDGEVTFSVTVRESWSNHIEITESGRVQGYLQPLDGKLGITDLDHIAVPSTAWNCSGLFGLSDSNPQASWVLDRDIDGRRTCTLTAHWPLAALLDRAPVGLQVVREGGLLRLSVLLASDQLPSGDVVHSSLGVRLASGDSVVASKDSSDLPRYSPCELTFRMRPLSQEVVPWVVAGIALLLIVLALSWPRSRPATTDGFEDTPGDRTDAPLLMVAVAVSPTDWPPPVPAGAVDSRGGSAKC